MLCPLNGNLGNFHYLTKDRTVDSHVCSVGLLSVFVKGLFLGPPFRNSTQLHVSVSNRSFRSLEDEMCIRDRFRIANISRMSKLKCSIMKLLFKQLCKYSTTWIQYKISPLIFAVQNKIIAIQTYSYYLAQR